MNVLIVAEEWPWPVNRGDRVRLDAIVRVLAARHRVTLAGAPGEASSPYPEIATIAWTPVKRRLRLLLHPLTPVTAALRMDPFAAAQVAKWASGYDRVLFFQLKTTPFIRVVSPEKVVAELTDALSLYYRRRGRSDIRWRVEAWRTARWESHVARRFPTVVASAHDADALGGLPLVAPNGIWPPPPDFEPSPRQGVALVVGNFHYYPNRSGLQRFLGDVWPMVLAQVPSARLWVAGAGAGREFDGPGVKRLGLVADLTPVYREAAVAIAPIDTGAGVKTKVLEALGHRVPVVSTVTGAEGIDPVPALTVVSNDADFVAALGQRLASSPRPMEREAWRALLERYDWHKTLAPLVRAIEGEGEGAVSR